MEALLSQYGIAGLQVALVGLLMWFMKREFDSSKKAQTEANDAHAKKIDKVYSRMDCFEASQHACQLANAKDFATKDEIGKVWERLDENSTDIAQIKGILTK